MNSAVSNELLSLIEELQSLPSLRRSYLAGGTNLALRFGHRTSEDIDLFLEEIIGKLGYLEIEKELRSHFSSRVIRILFPCAINDQFIFLRAFIASGSSIIKVEVLQNMKRIDSVQSLSGLNVATIRDIGLFKLLSCSSRSSVKDVYDLDYVTDHIDLKELIGLLKIKLDRDHGLKYHTIFDLNGLANPVENPSLLLKFDKGITASKNLPNHANNRILIQEGAKDWHLARISWRSKVRRLNRSMKI